jgi:hypothetical protein
MQKRGRIETLARERQSNVVPRDIIRNLTRFDAALWSGRGINSRIQICGAIVLGFFFFISGSFFLAAGLGIFDETGWKWDAGEIYSILSALALAVFGLIVGWRLLFNLLRTTRKPTHSFQKRHHNR